MRRIRINRIVFLMIMIILPIILTGCWDKVELEEQGFVALIGLDKYDKDKLEATYVITNPQGGGFTNVLGSSQKEPPSEIVTVRGTDVISARDLLGSNITRQITFAHVRAIVISEELARSDMLISTLDGLLRDRQVRRDIYMVISKEKASEFINKNNPPLETRPHKFYEFMSRQWQRTALSPMADLNRLMQRTEGKAGLFINIYGTTQEAKPNPNGKDDEYTPGQVDEETQNPTQIIGSAVLKDGKMIGTLNGEETRISLMLRPTFKIPSVLTTFADPEQKDTMVTVRIVKEEDAKIKIDVKGKNPKIKVEVPLLIDILAIPSGVDYTMDLKKQKMLLASITKQMTQKTDEFIKRTQSEFGGEPFLWSEVARKKFATWDEYKNYNWMEKYRSAEVSVDYDLQLRRIGKQSSPSDMIK